MSDNLYLFANNNGGQAEGNGSYRFYNMKIEGDSEGVNSGVDYVNYLDSDGNCSIDTGLPFNSSYKYVFNMYILESISSAIFSSNNFTYNAVTNNLKYGTFYGFPSYQGNETNHRTAWRTDNLLKVFDNGKYYIGNELISSVTSNQSSGNNVTLFCDSVSRLRKYQVYDNSRLIQDLRPCLDTQGVPCMYDEVSKKYFYNKGTGTFKYKKILRDFQPVMDSNNIPCLLDKINKKYYYNKGTGVFDTKEKVKYKKLKYIQGDGNSYIDTGLNIQNLSAWNIIAKYEKPTDKSLQNILFGASPGGLDNSKKNVHYRYLYYDYYQGFSSVNKISEENGIITQGFNGISNTSDDATIYLFAGNNKNQPLGTCDCKFYSFKIQYSSRVLMDLIPALDENNKVGMYDLVSEQFFYNQGTGTFGYEIEELDTSSDEYTEIEYIESTGTQYIDTGVVSNSNTDIDMTSRLSAMPYYFSGWKTQTNIVRLTESFIVELDLKYFGNRTGAGSILPNYLYVLSDGCYSLNGTDTTSVKVSTNKYDKVKIIANIEEKKEYVYINNKLIGEKAISELLRVSFGGSSNNYSSCYTHYIDIYKLSNMSLLYSLRPVMNDYSWSNHTYKIPMLYDEINSRYYQSSYGDNFTKNSLNYGYDNNYIYNKLKTLNKYSDVHSETTSYIPVIYDKTVYEYNGVDTTVQPNLVASSGATLTMGSQNLEQLNDDDIEIATNNGWSLI